MKLINIHLRNTGKIFLLIFIASMIFTCVQDSDIEVVDGENVVLNITANEIHFCNRVYDTIPATGASIIVKQQLPDDTITIFPSESGNPLTVDNSGVMELEIPNSILGINGLVIESKYEGYFIQKKLSDLICCCEEVTIDFETSCETNTEVEIECSNVDTTINVFITNKTGGCIKETTDIGEQGSNRVTINTSGNLKIDINPLLNVTEPFFVDPDISFTPEPDENGMIEINEEPLILLFFTETDSINVFETIVNLPVECNSDTFSTTSEIELILKTEICEDGCICPFGDNNQIEGDFYFDEKVAINTTQTFPNNRVFTVTDNILAEGCYMEVTNISRYPDSLNAETIPSGMQERYEWTINSIVGEQFRINNRFELDANFSPYFTGSSSDTFKISTAIYSDDIGLKDENCSFLVVFEGEGCTYVCPNLLVAETHSEIERRRNSDNQLLEKYDWGDTLSLNNSTTLSQKLTAYLGSLCVGIASNQNRMEYKLYLPKTDEILCSDLQLSLNMVGHDANYFYYSSTSYKIGEMDTASIVVQFNAPGFVEHINSGHDSLYLASLEITIDNINQDICSSQKIDIEANVAQSNVSYSNNISILTYSQKPNNGGPASFNIYKIDETDARGVLTGGKVQPSRSGEIRYSSDRAIPVNNNSSFYVDVDEPYNTTLTNQEPKLYLINSSSNRFKQITQFPIAYINPAKFASEMNTILDLVNKNNFSTYVSSDAISTGNTNFTFDNSNDSIMWTPSVNSDEMLANEMQPLNGIKLFKGGVYIVWNPTGQLREEYVNGTLYKSYCEVAFLLINDIIYSDDGRAIVIFSVAYPTAVF